MKVLFVNNYDAQQIHDGWQSGKNAAHHLWGITEFRNYGINVEILPFRSDRRGQWPRLARYGDLDQELRALRHNDFDALYAAAAPIVMGLGFLRSLGLFGKPIVAIMHHPLPGGRYPTMCVRGMDGILCLNGYVEKQLRGMFPEIVEKTRVVEWGMDTDFIVPAREGGEYMLCEGKTLRDYDTLCAALQRTPAPTKIFTTEDNIPANAPACVDIVPAGGKHASLSEVGRRIAESYNDAFVVAVPLKSHNMQLGLTSLLAAMARAKPVIITRNVCFDIDVEKEGCGLWVEPGDADGWVCAIKRILEHPAEAVEMGRRGRRLCETRYNIKRFAAVVAGVIKSVAE